MSVYIKTEENECIFPKHTLITERTGMSILYKDHLFRVTLHDFQELFFLSVPVVGIRKFMLPVTRLGQQVLESWGPCAKSSLYTGLVSGFCHSCPC
jgi:hypothetical protein